jgi:metallo-beta-lactamase family protein
MAELLFHGAAGEVTGSMHMIQVDGRWVALDCGLYQGHRAEAEEKNRQWPVAAKDISAVILSHAHIDHSGRLPRLVRDGFEGAIYCTPATRDLCAFMLLDSAHIQQEDVFYVNKKRARKRLAPVEPLYDDKDALATIRMMHGTPFGRWFQVVPGLQARFRDAGHMLGSAGVHLEFAKRNGKAPSLYYSGDVGRPDKPIIRDPQPFPPVDVLLCESTYGGRVNEPVEDARQEFVEVLRRTHERGGKVIIPAFSVGRTQTIVYYIQEEMAAGRIPRMPVFVDSPMSCDATEVFVAHPECYDADARDLQRQTGGLLAGRMFTYIRDVQESKRLHRRRKPCIIISASGMCEAGRIRHHIKNNIRSPKNTILIVGFQAAHTLGRRLADGAKSINLFHQKFPVRAEVVQIHGFSAHADQADLLRLITADREDIERVFLVHGEPEQSQVLGDKLRASGMPQVELGRRGQRVEL